MFSRRSLLLGVLGLVASGLVWNPPAASHENATSLQLFVPRKGGFVKSIPVGDNPYATGSYTLIADPVFDPTTGERVGRTTGICTVVRLMPRAHDSLLQCEQIVFLSDGTLTTSFGLRFSEAEAGIEPALAVTGGTGRFNAAGGTGGLEAGTMGDIKGDHLGFELHLP